MYLIITDKRRLFWDQNYNWPSVHNDWLRFDVLTLISWPAWISLHTRTCDSQALARPLQASGLALFPNELRAHFNNPVDARRQNDGPDIYVWGFPLWQGGEMRQNTDFCYLLFGCILRSPLFHNIRGFGDALGLQSRDTSLPSVAMTQTGLSTKTGADAKKDTDWIVDTAFILQIFLVKETPVTRTVNNQPPRAKASNNDHLTVFSSSF